MFINNPTGCFAGGGMITVDIHESIMYSLGIFERRG
jgi:hypothetical protein